MSKKNRQKFTASVSTGPTTSADLVAEYRIIRHDLLRVIIINVVFLAAVLVLYYSNRANGYLERFFEQVLHF